MELPFGLIMHGYFLGCNKRVFSDSGKTVYNVSIACGMDSFSISVNDFSSFEGLKQFSDILIGCRCYVSKNGRLYYVNGVLLSNSSC